MTRQLSVKIPEDRIGIKNGLGRTDHLETQALPEGPGCPWYLFHRLF
ncbi:unnamed protein product [Staurois parvus]|uniref:Uncharacterized protein n=1 Tax=Staurois parvus TaxID=386267 RepID=A0ABN9B1B1_9NEOB|nr:unnamed protein product [Staurois parvus]